MGRNDQARCGKAHQDRTGVTRRIGSLLGPIPAAMPVAGHICNLRARQRHRSPVLCIASGPVP